MHLAITESIGAGKSTVVKKLKELLPEYTFYSIDEYISSLYHDIEFKEKLESEFGTCDKKKLSVVYFRDSVVKSKIDNLFKDKIESFLKLYQVRSWFINYRISSLV